MQAFDEILRSAAESGASDIHLSPGNPVAMRVDGRLIKQEDRSFSAQDMEGMLALFMTGEMAQRLKSKGELNIVYELPEAGRFRISLYRKNGTLASAVRLLPARAPGLYEIGAPEAIKEVIREPSGILIINGRAGSGRSTTMASVINEINLTQQRHIVSIEENIEFAFTGERSVIDQRKLFDDTESYSAGILSAIREDADIIVLSELSDRESADQAMYAAETGKLVLACMCTPDAITAVKRILELYEPERQEHIKERLSGLLRAVLSQMLIPLNEGGRGAAFELLIMTQAVRNLLRDGKYGQITAIMQTDRRSGMSAMDDSIYEMLLMKRISEENALYFAKDKSYIRQRLNGI
ncbi:MAG TPA: type IV pili twitching motility protein PilT [Lachnospiraceae bacterium]|nr:type IV pili twitching motility protein PilT [Lachnospiraceae bacterium]